MWRSVAYIIVRNVEVTRRDGTVEEGFRGVVESWNWIYQPNSPNSALHRLRRFAPNHRSSLTTWVPLTLLTFILRNRFGFSKLCFRWSLGIYNFIWILKLRSPWINYDSFVAFSDWATNFPKPSFILFLFNHCINFFFPSFGVTCLYNGFLILFKRGEIKWIVWNILDANVLNGLFYLAVQVFRRKKSNTIVLAGLSGSGKTVLFYQVSVFDFIFFPFSYLWKIW